MLPVTSLLNPIDPDIDSSVQPSSPCSSYYTFSSAYSSPAPSSRALPMKQKIAKDKAIFIKAKIRGVVNFPPFEQLDENAVKEVERYRVFPLGRIQEFSRHIPYNSDKKDFYQKTNRESFEVFQYVFSAPGDEKEYTVMWDYNIGLVRITPFFKCCKYSKTTPAKMLNLNPGLKDITHSITGGALAAQGYWMPYNCALAVCTTFCYNIAGALIPLFGPDFPSRCVTPDSLTYGRMVIDNAIVTNARRGAEVYRLQGATSHSARQEYNTSTPHDVMPKRNSASPQLDSLDRVSSLRSQSDRDNLGRQVRLKRTFTSMLVDSPRGGDLDFETFSDASSNERYVYSPISPSSTLSSGWLATKALQTEVSEIPRCSPTLSPHQQALPYSPPLPPVSSNALSLDPWLSAVPLDTVNRRSALNSEAYWPHKRRAFETIGRHGMFEIEATPTSAPHEFISTTLEDDRNNWHQGPSFKNQPNEGRINPHFTARSSPSAQRTVLTEARTPSPGDSKCRAMQFEISKPETSLERVENVPSASSAEDAALLLMFMCSGDGNPTINLDPNSTNVSPLLKPPSPLNRKPIARVNRAKSV